MALFKVRRPGLLSTIQDLGRLGYQSQGFSPAGAVDYESAILANHLFNNSPQAAVIEMTMQGLSFEVLQHTHIATAGARLPIDVNGHAYPVGRVIALKQGDVVTLGQMEEGLRTYLAVPGGFKASVILGSASTHTRSAIGGYQGRALQRGDLLDAYPAGGDIYPYVIKKKEAPIIRTIRLIEGPEYDRFSAEAKEKLTTEWYVIQNQSDRMGIRLSGESLTTQDGAHDIISAPTQLGNVQVPKNGQPIILMNDRQSSGGYTRIATVAKIDILKLAQMRPGERFMFKMISIAEAQRLYENKLNDLRHKRAIYADRDFQYYRRLPAENISHLLKGAQDE